MEKTTYQVSEIEISYKPKFKASERPKIDSSNKAFNVLCSNWSDDKIEFLEEFKIILLNRANHVLGIVNISQGGLAGTYVDPKIIFSIALKANSSGIILSHNHPSGQCQPSQADVELTNRMVQIGALLELPILDHIIICPDRYYSFKDEGLI
ncbi:JAB domain-containing protein [Pedobacter sp. GR22-10]|uniref:JAB domain-containing protein n=1 Tax=Pedobacter sp. GR22-10 TaxID=2994472 RepID=UPI0022482395|nr:JAB domain-containing protein [Pedobacter sp. GR22-10]MCX2429561.1 JAB domain-containing protein [Pedobacter sp. GR22-10]